MTVPLRVGSSTITLPSPYKELRNTTSPEPPGFSTLVERQSRSASVIRVIQKDGIKYDVFIGLPPAFRAGHQNISPLWGTLALNSLHETEQAIVTTALAVL